MTEFLNRFDDLIETSREVKHRPTYDFVNFCRKLHENEEILAARGVGRASPAPPP